MNFTKLFPIIPLLVTVYSCKKNDTVTNSGDQLRFSFKFDSTQARLNNIGQPSTIAVGNAGQSPVFNGISAHYIELAPNALTALGTGAILYKAPEVTTGGALAIDFSKAIVKAGGEEFINVDLSKVPDGSYQYVRVSLAYQNADIKYMFNNAMFTGTAVGFIGYNTYIGTHKIKTSNQVVNANKAQGYWAFETLGQVFSGQAPAGATTVPNPLFATSPIPAGSCVVTAAFVDAGGNAKPLVVTNGRANSSTVILSLSTNKSFEWNEVNANGLFEPAAGETLRDMGVRGLKPILQ